ncbi:MAG: hypothetical protein LBU06_06230 [Desulfovibrio sp.]|jgi:hypothetical protein|nr:hypothetical protein [Desulfovibrio sp.]
MAKKGHRNGQGRVPGMTEKGYRNGRGRVPGMTEKGDRNGGDGRSEWRGRKIGMAEKRA